MAKNSIKSESESVSVSSSTIRTKIRKAKKLGMNTNLIYTNKTDTTKLNKKLDTFIKKNSTKRK